MRCDYGKARCPHSCRVGRDRCVFGTPLLGTDILKTVIYLDKRVDKTHARFSDETTNNIQHHNSVPSRYTQN